MKKAIFNDDELSAIIKESVDRELEIFRSYADYPEHPFRDEIENKMETLCRNVESGNIQSAVYHMGFAFYAKRCIAAAIIILAIAGITMPDTVIAAYHKLIEVVETVFEEYTEFRYNNIEGAKLEDDFVAIKIEPFLTDLREIRREQSKHSMELLYMNTNKQYVRIYQRKMIKNMKSISKLNTEASEREFVVLENETIELFYKEKAIYFIWIHNGYYIGGQSNLTKEKLIEFLRHID